MELVSTLSFGWAIPEEKVVQELINVAFTHGSSSFSCLALQVPVIRSSLLQLLLKHRYVIL